MQTHLRGRDLITTEDWTLEEIETVTMEDWFLEGIESVLEVAVGLGMTGEAGECRPT